MNYRMSLFKDRADVAGAKAREVAEKAAAEGRNMTADERRTYDASMAELENCLTGIKAAKADQAAMEAINATFAGIGGPVGKSEGRRLSFKGMAEGVANRMLTGDIGAKALAPSGAAVVAQSFTNDPVALGKPATSLLDLLPTQVQTNPQYSYLAQVTRTNNAAAVDDGDLKPTSVIGLERFDKELAVIAHLSEPIQRYWLLDNDALMAFIGNELQYGLGVAVEAKVIADINDTSGIQAQVFSTSPLQTIRKSITKLEIAGHTPAGIVLHPSDWETVELALSSTNAIEHLSLPYDPATRRLFGVPVATSVSATVGTGHVLGSNAVVVDTDSQGVSVQWSENVGDGFAYNQVVARCEGRYGTSVLSPLGVVVAELAD